MVVGCGVCISAEGGQLAFQHAALQWASQFLGVVGHFELRSSGLSREAYAERVPSADPVATAALDAVFAALAEKAAKREALRRAFESSGRPLADFAEMYGMDPELVRQILAPAAPTA